MPDYYPPPPGLLSGSIVWAYLRDSGGPNQDRSVPQQNDVLVEYCQRYGLRLQKVFADIHMSGTNDNRDQFNEMINLVEAGKKPAGILIWSFARWARNKIDSQLYKAYVRKRGIILHSLIDNIPDGKYGIVVETLIDVGNQEKAEQASEEAKRGLYDMVRQRAVPGTPPYGFVAKPIEIISPEGVKRIRNSWEPDSSLIPAVKKAFDMRAAGISLSEIHKELRLFSGINQYSYFYANPLYIGCLKYGDLVIDNYCEPMVDKFIWEEVQKIRQQHIASQVKNAPQSTTKIRRINAQMALTGLAHCARCGSPLFGHNSPRPDKSKVSDLSYKCTRARRRQDCDLPRISAPAAEKAIVDEIEQLAENPRYMAAIHAEMLDRSQKASSETAERISQINQRLKTLRTQITNLTNAITETGHSRALLQRLTDLENDQYGAETLLIDLQYQQNTLPNIGADEISAVLRKMVERMRTPERRREILHALLESVGIDRIDNRLLIGIAIKIPSQSPPENQNTSVPTYMSHQRESNP
ncbi:MAG: recombinase family protein [Anaerolineales bacterium]|nr:recombinase family protein [Anaerolineales bacterium]